MMIGLGLSICSGQAAGFTPAGLSPTLWCRASFSASPWVGTTSLGGSGSRNLSEGTNAPGTSALGSRTAADFDGTNDILKGDPAVDGDLFDANAGSLAFLYNCDAAAAAVNPFTDGAMFTNAGNTIALAINATGPRPHIHDGAYKSIQLTQAVGSWTLAQMKWDGVNLKARVNAGLWTTLAAGPVSGALGSGFFLGKRYDAGVFYNGKVGEIIAFDTVLSDAVFDQILEYTRAFHGQPLL